ncbi:branched-chain amino acid transport system II carrier protein [uncultured Enterococcus sp.]|uniref:branched-chain amino acid transport system II carrier protein n=1 Tax=uncultured Enterococcus sp. TaxID=167972 RepID=UPI0025F3EE04|nr:branched-chain amino acid transport system II carrier protein [uncultured Enterococcus sp.]
MKKQLSMKEYLFLGSLLFGMFFGAGNLIFPVHMGQEAGANVFLANLGFLVTGIGLPFLGIIAIGLSKTNGLFEVAHRVSRWYAYIFTILLYLVIGPFFALPRLATTSFEIGISPFLSDSMQTPILALFSIAFFLLAWFFSRKPSNLLEYIGKFLNPVFLILLAILLIVAFIHPLGSVASAPVAQAYQEAPFLTGFTQGYNTLDALAALAFGIIVVNTIKQRGINQPQQIAIDTIKAGSISIVLMGIIYTLLTYLGTMSVGKFAVSENGGIALAQLSNYYLGTFGSIILALIVVVACLKTAVGLISAFSETFVELFPSRSYLFFATIVSILPCLFANVGLTNIITYSTPVLLFIYPLAITLILLTIINYFIPLSSKVYQMTTYFTLIAAFFDGLNVTPDFIKNSTLGSSLITFAKQYLPFFTYGMGWITPAIVGLVIGLIWHLSTKSNK